MTLKHPTPGIGYFKIDHREVSEVDLIVTKRDDNNRPLTGWKNEYGAICLQRSEGRVFQKEDHGQSVRNKKSLGWDKRY